MVAPCKDTRNKFFHTSAFNTSNSNMSLVFNVDIVYDPVVNTIIYSNNNSNKEVRDRALVPSASSSRSVLVSSSNKSKEEYVTKVQRESDNMD